MVQEEGFRAGRPQEHSGQPWWATAGSGCLCRTNDWGQRRRQCRPWPGPPRVVPQASGEPIANMAADIPDNVGMVPGALFGFDQGNHVIVVDENAELRRALEIKHIPITGFPGGIEGYDRVFSLQRLNDLWGQRVNQSKIDAMFRSGVNGSLAMPIYSRVFRWVGVYFGVICQRQRSEEGNCVALKIAGRRDTSVFESSGKLNWPVQAKALEFDHGVNIRPQLSDTDIGDHKECCHQSQRLEGSNNDGGDAKFYKMLIRRAALLIVSFPIRCSWVCWGF
jgi:hypothetical protein